MRYHRIPAPAFKPTAYQFDAGYGVIGTVTKVDDGNWGRSPQWRGSATYNGEEVTSLETTRDAAARRLVERIARRAA